MVLPSSRDPPPSPHTMGSTSRTPLATSEAAAVRPGVEPFSEPVQREASAFELEGMVLHHVMRREAFIKTAKQLMDDFNNILLRGRAQFYRELANSIESIRRVGVEVVEAIVAWRRSLGLDQYGVSLDHTAQLNQEDHLESRDFMWNGEDYLVLMYRDLSWIDHHQDGSRWLGFRAEQNPFLVPPEFTAKSKEAGYVCKMSQSTQQRAAQMLMIVKKAVERNVQRMRRAGVETRFQSFEKQQRNARQTFGQELVGVYDHMDKEYNVAQAILANSRGDEAARVLQRAARRMFASHELAWRRQKKAEQDELARKAAMLLQGQVRAKRGRYQLTLRKTAQKIQAIARGLIYRKRALIKKICELEGEERERDLLQMRYVELRVYMSELTRFEVKPGITQEMTISVPVSVPLKMPDVTPLDAQVLAATSG